MLDENTMAQAPFQLVYVGLLQRQIDVMPILASVKGREDIMLTFVGDGGEGEQYADAMCYIEQHKMRNVDVVGRVMPEIVSKYLKNMDVGVMPMITNSLPNKVFDYIASFLPILVLGENDCSKFVDDLGIGWSCPFDEAFIGKWLDGLSNKEIITKSKRIAEIRSDYSRDVLHEDILKLISE